MRLWVLAVLIFVAHAGACGQAASPLVYTWKAGDLFRFDYQKTICVVQPDETGAREERRTEVAAVLILEIKTVSPAGAGGTLRFDSPRLTLPAMRLFPGAEDEIKPLPDKNRAVARTIEGALKTASWTVLLSPSGAITVESRKPASYNEWIKDLSNAGGWRKRLNETVARLVEQDLGLKAQTVDRELLLCTDPAEASSAPGQALHPLRAGFAFSSKTGKTNASFERRLPAASATGYAVPALAGPTTVHIQPQKLKMHESKAVFDSALGMLDSLIEDYEVKLDYEYRGQHLDQEVRVQYKLKRLAPPIVKAD
ncbi:MAG TPA: hypothetical protein VGP72_33410 [Planctomycetota bacterium]|jgi:hypothetical protein